MDISEVRLRELILHVLKDLEAEKAAKEEQKNVYMLCLSEWDERYAMFMKRMEMCKKINICPVIPHSWKEKGYESVLRHYKSCHKVLYRSSEKPAEYKDAVTIFPVVSKDLAAKAALCISDTFETLWLESCIEAGSKIIFLRSGLKKFTGNETECYRQQILSYYRKILEYGIEISEGI